MSEKKQRRKFDKELLDECMKRDGATLVGEYNGGGRRTLLRYRCKCSNEREKTFCLIEKSGAICSDCIYRKQCEILAKGRSVEIQSKRIEAQRNPDRDGYYTMKTLNLCIQQSEAILEGTYATLVNTTDIHFICNCGIKCSDRFVNIAGNTKEQRENPRGAYCDECISKRMIKKRNDTNMKRHGKLGGINQEKMREKTIQTCLKKYGTTSSNQAESVKHKKIQSSLEKYGTEYPAQNEEVQEKIQKNSKKMKEYKMPSGTIRKVQGDEPFALDILIKTNTEEQIKTDRKDIPRIKYKVDEKYKYYFPDIFIPHENKIIEVKSTWTYNCKTDNIQEKANACKEQGYTYEIWIFDGKKKRVKIIA